MKQIGADRVLGMIRIAIQVEGSQKAFAERVGISEQYLTDILRGRRPIGGATCVLDFLGLERVVTFKRKDGGSL